MHNGKRAESQNFMSKDNGWQQKQQVGREGRKESCAMGVANCSSFVLTFNWRAVASGC